MTRKYWIEVKDDAGELWTIGDEPFEADSPEEAEAEWRRQSGWTDSADVVITELVERS